MSTRTLNHIDIIGNVGEDAKLTQTSNNTPVCTFRLATNRTYSPSNSDKVHEDTQWHNVVAFGDFAQVCHRLVKKSLKVYIGGRIKSTEFNNDDGSTTTKTEVVADKMIILDGEHKQDQPESEFQSYTNY
jgi:single stranded DNA-binding protein (ssb)